MNAHAQSHPPSATAARPTPGGVTLDVERVSHDYGGFRALDDVSLNVGAGEVVALLGPSGCGKTTLLRVVAGFLNHTSGTVRVDGSPVDRVPPGRRGVGIVFQNYALFPHMSVAENVGYGLAARGRSRRQIRDAVERFLGVVQMSSFARRRPRELSGGQQQRVALARALAIEPGILLLDEPFAALDKNLRLDMQIEVKRLQREFGLTAILVTHDQEEAMSVADRVAVMNGGRIEQLGTPVDVYDRPASLFVNSFVGSSNLLPGRLEAAAGGLVAALDVGARLPLPGEVALPAGTRILASVRPEELVISGEPDTARFPVRCRMDLPVGGTTVLDLAAEDGTAIKLVRMRAGAPPLPVGPLFCGLGPNARVAIFPADTAAT
ncbi:ABC transporter ATP-binding protein [Acuticoccus sp. I52.16.1]|uniref:ABC transporter ATP-binding protein n=1 Tax=Acuticoccus sp. I52.16.1 TaxID=2928472 RepID=UPI001FD5A1C7|nr:ABC transporter ATP-binding protein [Acuticoccus sp. I52.16.1]UOM34879.1 ABC transporter ATP-binding protein [Acuticoccus sp. I52.16.1]